MTDTSIDSTFQRKYVSLHSEDRDIRKWPNSNHFMVTLPESIRQIVGLKISHISMPRVYRFSKEYDNITLDITVNGINGKAVITEGNYTPEMLATELTNQINGISGVSDMNVYYHKVLNKFVFVYNDIVDAQPFQILPTKLSGILGIENTKISETKTSELFNYLVSPSDKQTSTKECIISDNPVTIEMPLIVYLEINSFNMMDEIIPDKYNAFRTDGAFCKLVLPCCNDYDDNISGVDSFLSNEKQFKTPLERIGKIELKLRFHDGTLVDLKKQPFSLTLEFIKLRE